MRAFFCLALAWSGAIAAGAASAQDAATARPQGEPRSEAPLRDAEFGVSTRQFGLQRRVEMYQWRAVDGGYAKTWSERPIDSAAFAPGHENPGDFPLRTRYWIAQRITLDGRPLDEDVLKAIGRWRGFRPGFSALPGNLSATFQPEGDGLGSAENPLQPQVGDLRVTWHELALPPLAGKVALEAGVWVALPATRPAAVDDTEPARADSHFAFARRPGVVIGFIAFAFALAVGFYAASRRRRTRRT